MTNTTQSNFSKLLRLHKSDASNPLYSSSLKKNNLRNMKSVQQLTLHNVEIPNDNDIVEMPEISEADAIRFKIEEIRGTIENLLFKRQELQTNINDCKTERSAENEIIAELKKERKIKERTHLLLENPEVNLTKMDRVLATTQERIKKLKEQWEEHRVPLVQQLEKAQQSSTKKFVSTFQCILKTMMTFSLLFDFSHKQSIC